MGQFSVEIFRVNGSNLSGNQHSRPKAAEIGNVLWWDLSVPEAVLKTDLVP